MKQENEINFNPQNLDEKLKSHKQIKDILNNVDLNIPLDYKIELIKGKTKIINNKRYAITGKAFTYYHVLNIDNFNKIQRYCRNYFKN